jgi:hypothetical protein
LAATGSSFELSNVWSETDAGLRLVARAGEAAPGLSVAFSQFEELTMTDGGIMGFKALLSGPKITVENRESIWLDRHGALTLVARAADEAPDPTKARRFLRFESPVAVNGDGKTAFFARTRDKELEVVQDSGFYALSTNGLAPIAAAAGSAISNESGVVFNAQSFEAPFADDPVVNAAGVTVFRGFIEGSGVNETNLNGLWQYDPHSGLRLLLRGGDAAAGTPGATFVSFPSIPTINNKGDTAFWPSIIRQITPLARVRQFKVQRLNRRSIWECGCDIRRESYNLCLSWATTLPALRAMLSSSTCSIQL